MQVITLQSKQLSVSIKKFGAELSSIILNENNQELLWQANPESWQRHAPNLFPIVGKLKSNILRHQGKEYPMTQHGFARDLPFEVTSQTSNSCTLTLEDSEYTHKQYPFKFKFNVIYTLEENSLNICYQIKNLSEESLPANVGAHPAFKWPLTKNAKPEDHSIEFEHNEPAPISRLNEGLVKQEKHLSPIKGNKLSLNRSYFKDDAIIMDKIKSRKVIYTATGTPKIELEFSDFSYLGIWTQFDEKAEFICIEPWNGHASPEEFDGEFSDKPAIIHIQPNSTQSWSYSIKIS